jgi:hypothetical protein
MGTDAVAGAHGQNAREVVYRAQVGGQPAMDAIVAVKRPWTTHDGMKRSNGSSLTGQDIACRCR